MQRVVIIFVSVLTVVRSTPFDLDSVNALKEDSEHNDDYKIEKFEPDKNSNFIDEPDEGKSTQGVTDLFGDVQSCDFFETINPPKEGCAYVANGNVYFLRVMPAIDIDDVYVAFGDAGIEECEVGEDGLKDEPEDGCFWIKEDKESVYWIGVYDEDVVYQSGVTDDIRDAFDYIEKCDFTVYTIPEEGCSLIDENGIHLLNIFNNINVNDFKRLVGKLNMSECIFDEERGLINKDPCYWVNRDMFILHFLNLHRKPEGVQDNDDDDDDSKETYGIPDGNMEIPLSVVKTATRNGNLQQKKLKDIFNQRSSVAKKAKVVVPKKIQSRKKPQEVQQKLGRRDLQNGRHGDNGDRDTINHTVKISILSG